jgi:fatty acid desaturase
MTAPMPQGRGRVDGRRLWSGGVATAVVAALVALVGVLVCRWLLDIPLLASRTTSTGMSRNLRAAD